MENVTKKWLKIKGMTLLYPGFSYMYSVSLNKLANTLLSESLREYSNDPRRSQKKCTYKPGIVALIP